MKSLLPFILGRYLNAMSYLYPSHAASLGFRVFCFPVRTPLRHYHKEFFDTAEHRKLAHNGEDIRLLKWNDGPKKILFLHGWQSHSFRWKNYLDGFPADEYTLFSLDAPGHGLSTGKFLTVPLYSEVIERTIIEHGPFDAVVSHSLGSFTMLYTLFRLPLLPVGKLVLLAPPGEATEFLAFFKKSLGLGSRTMSMIADHFEDIIHEPVEYFSAIKFASTMNRPGLIIHDEGDGETSFEHSVNIHKVWKRSELLITKGLSHNLKSPEIISKVSAFIREEHSERHPAYSNDLTLTPRL